MTLEQSEGYSIRFTLGYLIRLHWATYTDHTSSLLMTHSNYLCDLVRD